MYSECESNKKAIEELVGPKTFHKALLMPTIANQKMNPSRLSSCATWFN